MYSNVLQDSNHTFFYLLFAWPITKLADKFTRVFGSLYKMLLYGLSMQLTYTFFSNKQECYSDVTYIKNMKNEIHLLVKEKYILLNL